MKRGGVSIAIGVVLVLIGLWVIGSNEHDAAAWRAGMARHGGNVLVLGEDASPAAGLYGRKVLVTGTPEVVEPPRDRDFRVSVDTPVLVRKVSMFQWREVHVGKDLSYQMSWIDHPVDSSRFKQPRGHLNTQPFPFRSQRFSAAHVRLGNFTLASAIVKALPMPLEPVKPDMNRLPANLQASFYVRDGTLSTSSDATHPRLGDLRVRWLAMPLKVITVVATVDGDHLVPAKNTSDGKGFRVQVGQRSLTDVFADLPLPTGAVWAWRVLGVVLAWAGMWLIVRCWRSGRAAVAASLAAGVALLAIVAGGMWLAVSVLVAVAAWVIAVLAALAAWLSWQRLA